ncbi:MAG: metallophosphoesterase [Prevotella sp.]|nr:metallophosphoesterase [Prevotella sp.]
MIARYAIPFFLIVTFLVTPLVVYLLCRYLLPRRWGRKTGVVLALLAILFCLYGLFVGYQQLEVRHIEYASEDIPAAFDGYRIVQFSDAHIGTMTGSRKWMLERAVDSMLAQHPDMIVFTGDLQNVYPEELVEHLPQLRRLKAPDGLYSVLGNHDYAIYQPDDSLTKEANCKKTQELERQAGWTLLMNEHRVIHRDSDSIVIAGMENWGTIKRMPRRGDVKKTLEGIRSQQPIANNQSPFIILLQHDPTAWREKILPECQAQLTLSGHTHGGQVRLLGLSPASLSYKEYGGWVHEGARSMFISTGLGALIPFRLGIPGEIVVITLHRKK